MGTIKVAEVLASFATTYEKYGEDGKDGRYVFGVLCLNMGVDYPVLLEEIVRAGLAHQFLQSVLEGTDEIEWIGPCLPFAHKFAVDMANEYVDAMIDRAEVLNGDTSYHDMIWRVIELLPLRFAAHFCKVPGLLDEQIKQYCLIDEPDFPLAGWCRKPLPLPDKSVVHKCA